MVNITSKTNPSISDHCLEMKVGLSHQEQSLLPDTLLNKNTILTLTIVAFLNNHVSWKRRFSALSHHFVKPAYTVMQHFPGETHAFSPHHDANLQDSLRQGYTGGNTMVVCPVPEKTAREHSAPREDKLNDTCQGTKPNYFNPPKTCLPQGLTSVATDQENIKPFLRTGMYLSEGAVLLLALLMQIDHTMLIILPT